MGGIVGKTGKYKRTPEMLRNYSEAAKHRTYTEEGRRKIKEAFERTVASHGYPRKGKKGKISAEHLYKWMGKPRHTIPHTKEVKEKMRVANIKGRLKQANKKEPTSIEKAVYDYLVLKGIIFEKQKHVGGGFIADAYIPSLNLVIEADGTYWHTTPRGIETGKRKNKYLLERGYKLIRLSEGEIKDGKFIEKLMF